MDHGLHPYIITAFNNILYILIFAIHLTFVDFRLYCKP
jgi:hypothetical protein